MIQGVGVNEVVLVGGVERFMIGLVDQEVYATNVAGRDTMRGITASWLLSRVLGCAIVVIRLAM